MFVLAAAFAVGVARDARAQELPLMDLAGGYSTLRELGEGVGLVDTYESGWFVSGSRRLPWSRFAFVGHIDRHERDNFVGEHQSRTAILGGARVSLLRWSRLGVFAQSVAGLERFFEPGLKEDGLALQSGAGADLRLWLSLGARIQGDFRYVRQGGDDYTSWRLGVGGVITIN
jgi:hypothetical protein